MNDPTTDTPKTEPAATRPLGFLRVAVRTGRLPRGHDGVELLVVAVTLGSEGCYLLGDNGWQGHEPGAEIPANALICLGPDEAQTLADDLAVCGFCPRGRTKLPTLRRITDAIEAMP
ncbi:MAG TPA: hypothetical protein VNA25_29310 [Phycisphaerae bacterium]|nr:hypothetical protein [Phycisphaerae bacterium]